ncbi:hypothetical protein MNEG_15114, partial [Monoraphidium neglectum]
MATGVKQAIARVEQEVTQVREEIAGLKAGLKVEEDCKERKLMQQQQLAALQQQLGGLHQQLGGLQQQLAGLQQQQP